MFLDACIAGVRGEGFVRGVYNYSYSLSFSAAVLLLINFL